MRRQGGSSADAHSLCFPEPLPYFQGINYANKRRFHIMVKPVGASCNMGCTYCYYLHKKQLLNEPAHVVMDDETLRLCIEQYCTANQAEEIVFSWQGGEPTLAGLDFYRKVVAMERACNKPERVISNTLQTNGTLIDEEWASFLKENSFRVGLSIDGPCELHDCHRHYRDGSSTFADIMRCHDLLRRYAIPFTVLTTVNRDNVGHALEVYRFLTRDLGADYVQFNPCAEHITLGATVPGEWLTSQVPRRGSARLLPGHKNATVAPWSVPAEEWGEFLCTVFDEWLARDLGRVLVNWFETAVAQTMGLPAQICPCGELCGKGIAVNYNGKVYSCDHYVYPEYELGDIHENDLGMLAFSPRQQAFAYAKQRKLPQECLHCAHGALCWGQCPRHRFVRTANGQAGLSYLCPGWKMFYEHAKPALRELANALDRPGLPKLFG